MRSLLVAATVLATVAGCSAPDGGLEPRAADVVVASFNFDESRLLAEIYAQALEDEGLAVRRQHGLGQRELVLPALRGGFVDVVPEYAGSALDATAPGSAVDVGDRAVVTALRSAVEPWGLRVLAPARASNENVVVTTAQLAEEHGIRTLGDLAPLAPALVLGGPPECPARPRCLPGLARHYGLTFDAFVPLTEAELVRQALEDGVIDVGVLFATDAVLADDDLLALEDDRLLQPQDRVVPMVRAEVLGAGPVAEVLDQVSSRLTTENLRFLNWRLANAGTTIVAEARGWLIRQGLVDR